MLSQWMYDQIYTVYFASYQKWTSQNSRFWEMIFRGSVVAGRRYFPAGYMAALKKNPIYGLNKKEERREKIVASLTTFPARVEKVWMTIETIMRQSAKPDRIELWLSREQFPNELVGLPKELVEQTKRGLSICFCDDDLRSHKKYYYAMQNNPDALVIIFDDDFFYPSDTIKLLLKEHVVFPNAVIGMANTCFHMHNFLRPIDWKMAVTKSGPEFNLGICGGSGTLFPVGVFIKEAFEKKKIKDLSFLADDQWLTVMTYLNNRKIATIGRMPFCISIPETQSVSLTQVNNAIESEINNNTQWEKTIGYYKDRLSEWIAQID